MSYKINFGGWESVFAVPTAIVDKGLKLASETQLKVLLYILRNSQNDLSDELVAKALSIHEEEVADSIDYWSEKGLFVKMGESLEMASAVPNSAQEAQGKPETEVTAVNSQPKSRVNARPIKPEPAYVAKRLKADSSLAVLMDEAQRILEKMLSNVDMATLVMLHDTDGLPVEVILMLMEHCAKIGKGTLRYIEKTGIAWANEGVNTISLAEEKIKRQNESSEAWKKVSAVFGLRIGGTPTKKQLAFADTWVNEWMFSEDMLRLAYEKCVDAKSELNMGYVNGILKKWNEEGLRSIGEVEERETAKKSKKSTGSESASYDIDAYEKYSMFD